MGHNVGIEGLGGGLALIEEIAIIAAGLLTGFLLYAGCRPLGAMTPKELSQRKEQGRVSVIIPARNEEGNLPRLLDSLRRQSVLPLEIIVVDDDSEDRTAEFARLGGAVVVSPGPLPPGWNGKSWACWRGALASRGDWLIFVDADAWFEQDGLGVLLAESERMKAGGVLTVQPYHEIGEAYESLSAFFNIVVALSIGQGSVLAKGRRRSAPPGGYGPCLALSKETYACIGGHQRVRGEILEHHALCRVAAAWGLPVRNRLGRGVLAFRMYPEGVKSLLSGWAKSLASGAASTGLPRLCGVSLWIAGASSSASMLAAQLFGYSTMDLVIAVAAYLFHATLLYALLRRVGSFGLVSALFYPISLAAFIFVFGYSLFRTFALKKVSWKGRAVQTGGGKGS